MATPLRVLMCEDSEDDVALAVRALRQGGYDPYVERVDTAAAMGAALDREAWEVVIGDYSMPQFSAPAALGLLRERGLELPLIILSGSIGEETAVDMMRSGAYDYVLKDRPSRLASAVERALQDAELQRERRRAEEERARLLERERAARAEAEAALRVREEFLTIAAHELKTPVAVLMAMAQLALRRLGRQREVDPAQVGHALELIEQQSEKLGRLVGQLLDVSRIEAGQFTISPEPADLARLVENTVSLMQATTSKHRLVLDALPTAPARVDPLRFEQVLTNLLDNAIRYSPAGQGIGEIAVRLSRPAAGTVCLEVRDHGTGVPEAERSRLFARFHHGHTASYASGLGLGLHISRRIVELHGGQIDVDFPPDGGTRFVVCLPTGQADATGTGEVGRAGERGMA